MLSLFHQAEKIFTEMSSRLSADVVKQVGAIYQWNILGADGKVAGTWTADLKSGSGSLYSGPAKPKADCTLALSEETLEGLVTNSIDAMKAFMSGKLKVTGNVMLAQKLKALFASEGAVGAKRTAVCLITAVDIGSAHFAWVCRVHRFRFVDEASNDGMHLQC